MSDSALNYPSNTPAPQGDPLPSPPPEGDGPDLHLHRQVRNFIVATEHELVAALLTYADVMPPTLISIGKAALRAPGKVMAMPEGAALEGVHIDRLPRWPVFVLLSCLAALEPERREAEWRKALPGAVAVEISMAAADLLDEIADADPSPIVREYGPGQALNTANLMLVMSQQLLLRSAQGAGGVRALAALEALQGMLVRAATGQHLDMLYERLGPDEVTLEMSAHMTELKAGALISGACRIGALLSGAGEEVVEMVASFGKEIGSIAQLINDVQDVVPHMAHEDEAAAPGVPGAESMAPFPAPKTDLRQRKRTLPVVFTLRDDSPQANAVQRAFRGEEDIGEDEMRRAILEVGGIHFANLIAEVHRQKALEIIEQIDSIRPGSRAILSLLVSGG